MFLDLKKRWKYIEKKGLEDESKPANKYTVALAVILIMLVFLLFSSTFVLAHIFMFFIEMGVTTYHVIGVTAFVILAILMIFGKAEKAKK